MNSLINDIKDIKWSEKKQPLKEEDLLLVQNKIPFSLPKKFIDLLKISDGGWVNYDFDYYDVGNKAVFGNGISIIYGAKQDEYEHDLINAYYNPPEFFPKNLVPFGDVASSCQICFDYRMDYKATNPPVIYWNSEFSEGEDISRLADDFIGFLRMLREPEPIENYLKKD